MAIPVKMKTFVFITLLLCFSQLCSADEPRIVMSSVGNRDYYHLRFSLTPTNCELSIPVSERKHRYGGSNEYHFAEGGQFEVFVRSASFPVHGPVDENRFLILRMPWTDPAIPNAVTFIAEKRKLFEQIGRMKTTGVGAVDIVVELNPYIKVLQENPLQLELTGRNIFFRQAYGQYIDYLGPLIPER